MRWRYPPSRSLWTRFRSNPAAHSCHLATTPCCRPATFASPPGRHSARIWSPKGPTSSTSPRLKENLSHVGDGAFRNCARARRLTAAAAGPNGGGAGGAAPRGLPQRPASPLGDEPRAGSAPGRRRPAVWPPAWRTPRRPGCRAARRCRSDLLAAAWGGAGPGQARVQQTPPPRERRGPAPRRTGGAGRSTPRRMITDGGARRPEAGRRSRDRRLSLARPRPPRRPHPGHRDPAPTPHPDHRDPLTRATFPRLPWHPLISVETT